ncbi:MAG: hypothetical protein NT150_03635 [Bacteroidetes bacterium]|nr:hypothetical protein [Bacteroidota bacterium]
MKNFTLPILVTILSFCAQNLSAQINIEDVIADTACACLQKIKTDSASTKISAEYNNCMAQAVLKNSQAIIDSYNSGEQGKKIDEQNKDNGRLMIKTQNVLAKKCPDYDRVYGKIRSMHQSRQ